MIKEPDYRKVLTKSTKKNLLHLPYNWSIISYLCKKIEPELLYAKKNFISFMQDSGLQVDTTAYGNKSDNGWGININWLKDDDNIEPFGFFAWHGTLKVLLGGCCFMFSIEYYADINTREKGGIQNILYVSLIFNKDYKPFSKGLLGRIHKAVGTDAAIDIRTNQRAITAIYHIDEFTTLNRIHKFFNDFKYVLWEIQEEIARREGVKLPKRPIIEELTLRQRKELFTPADRYLLNNLPFVWGNIQYTCFAIEPIFGDILYKAESYMADAGFELYCELLEGGIDSEGCWLPLIHPKNLPDIYSALSWHAAFAIEKGGYKFRIYIEFSAQSDYTLPENSQLNLLSFRVEEVKKGKGILSQNLFKELKKKKVFKPYEIDYIEGKQPTIVLEYILSPQVTLHRIETFAKCLYPVIDRINEKIDKRKR